MTNSEKVFLVAFCWAWESTEYTVFHTHQCISLRNQINNAVVKEHILKILLLGFIVCFCVLCFCIPLSVFFFMAEKVVKEFALGKRGLHCEHKTNWHSLFLTEAILGEVLQHLF